MSLRSIEKEYANQFDTNVCQPGLPWYCVACCGARKAFKMARNHYKAKKAGQHSILGHVGGLPHEYAEMRAEPNYNSAYANGYNTAVDFIIARMG